MESEILPLCRYPAPTLYFPRETYKRCRCCIIRLNVNVKMTRIARSQISSLVRICLCFSIVIATLAAAAAAAERECDKTKCPGPLMYYKDLRCTPIYKKPDDCCAVKYNCEHLKDMSSKKCYAKGHEYKIGERIKDEDTGPCNKGCICTEGYRGVAKFSCAIVDCFETSNPDCYLKQSHDSCCSGPEVCPHEESKLATCLVDDQVYTDGQSFQPKSDPDKDCICMPGYAGKNVEPFCLTRKNVCDVAFHNPLDIHENCAPVYYHTQDPLTNCSVFSRCQNANDTVIPASNSSGAPNDAETTKSIESDDRAATDPAKQLANRPNQTTTTPLSDDMTCKFGNLTMKLGDRLNQATGYDSVCVKCVCEVPPVPTCQRLSDTECDVTIHSAFD